MDSNWPWDEDFEGKGGGVDQGMCIDQIISRYSYVEGGEYKPVGVVDI